jgi:hypothetical protein
VVVVDFAVGPESARRASRIRAIEAVRAKNAASPKQAKAFAAWQADQRKAATIWTIARPAKLDGGLTKLVNLQDGSVLALGDTTKRDVYTLEFEDLPDHITAIRLEALPVDGCLQR